VLSINAAPLVERRLADRAAPGNLRRPSGMDTTHGRGGQAGFIGLDMMGLANAARRGRAPAGKAAA